MNKGNYIRSLFPLPIDLLLSCFPSTETLPEKDRLVTLVFVSATDFKTMKKKKSEKYLCERNLVKTQFSSPIGPLNIETCETGIHSVNLDETVTNDNFLEKGVSKIQILQTSKTSSSKSEPSHESVNQFQNWLENYFYVLSKEEPQIDICPSFLGVENERNFRQNVWWTCMNEIKFGQTVSYSGLAKLCQNPGASQAVGSAMSNNRIMLIMPCHRVVKADGSTGKMLAAWKNENAKIFREINSHYLLIIKH